MPRIRDMKVHVLTTPRCTERQEQVRKYWDGWNINFHYGYDYRDLNCPEEYSRQFALGCCWCGHHKIWKELSGEKGWQLIIEDDAVPRAGIDDAIHLATTSENDYQVIKLFHVIKPPNGKIFSPDGQQKHQLYDLKGTEFKKGTKHWVSTAAYLIRNTKRAAREVLFATPDLAMHLTSLKVGGVWPLGCGRAGGVIIPPRKSSISSA